MESLVHTRETSESDAWIFFTSVVYMSKQEGKFNLNKLRDEIRLFVSELKSKGMHLYVP